MVDCSKDAKFLCQIIQSDWILRVIDFGIRILLSNSCVTDWRISSGCFLAAEARGFLDTIGIWHDLVQPKVNTEPHRNGKSQNCPA